MMTISTTGWVVSFDHGDRRRSYAIRNDYHDLSGGIAAMQVYSRNRRLLHCRPATPSETGGLEPNGLRRLS